MSAPGKLRQRKAEIKRKHKRYAKIAKLKMTLEKAKSDAERAVILKKLFKISPNYPVKELQPTA